MNIAELKPAVRAPGRARSGDPTSLLHLDLDLSHPTQRGLSLSLSRGSGLHAIASGVKTFLQFKLLGVWGYGGYGGGGGGGPGSRGGAGGRGYEGLPFLNGS